MLNGFIIAGLVILGVAVIAFVRCLVILFRGVYPVEE